MRRAARRTAGEERFERRDIRGCAERETCVAAGCFAVVARLQAVAAVARPVRRRSYRAARARGGAPSDALRAAPIGSGTGIVFGAITTAIAFYAFLPARFGAFAQVGGLSGTGILRMCLPMLVMVPALVAAWKKQALRPVHNHEWPWLHRLGAGVVRFRASVIALVLAAAAALVPGVLQVRRNRDVSQIYPDDLNSVRWLRVVEKEFGWSPNTSPSERRTAISFVASPPNCPHVTTRRRSGPC